MLSKKHMTVADTVKLNKKVKEMAESEKFQKTYPKIATAYANLQSALNDSKSETEARKTALRKAFVELNQAIAFYKEKTSWLDFARKAKLTAFYQYYANEMQQNFPNEFAYKRATDNLIAGPRNKNDATIALEFVVKALLNPKKQASTHFFKGELIITIDDEEYNMTDILKFKPDFDQLRFSKEELNHYQAFQEKMGLPEIEVLVDYDLVLKSTTPLRPYTIEISIDEQRTGYTYRVVSAYNGKIETGVVPWDSLPPDAPDNAEGLAVLLSDHVAKESLLNYITDYTCYNADERHTLPRGKITALPAIQENYDSTDTESEHLTYPEKLAITLYTGPNFFKEMQQFLRTNATIYDTGHKSTPLNTIKQIILGICVASHALSKPLSINYDPDARVSPPPPPPPPLPEDPHLSSSSIESPPPPSEPNYETLHRGEVAIESVINRRRQDLKDNKVTSSTGFTSVTSNRSVAEKTFTAPRMKRVLLQFSQPAKGMARKISKLSRLRGEGESLLVAGTEYKVTDYKEYKDNVEIEAVPVRSLNNVSHPNAYSRFTFNKKMNAMKVKLQELERKMSNPSQIQEWEKELIEFGNAWSKDKKHMNAYFKKHYSKTTRMVKYEPEDAAIHKKLKSMDKEFTKLVQKYHHLSQNKQAAK